MARLETETLPARDISVSEDQVINRLPLVAGGLGLLLLIIAAVLGQGSREFYYSYLAGYFYYLTIALGALIFTLIQFATRAGWSVVVRRLAENVAGTLPLFLVLFLPLVAGLGELYEWTHEEVVEGDPILAGKSSYLNTSFFLVRSCIYLVLWTAMAWWFRRQSLKQDRTAEAGITRRLQSVSAPAIIVFALTITFASFDWVMSLDPHWYSTIFGVYIFGGSIVSALALLILVALTLQGRNLLREAITPEHFHDLGKLLLGFVVFWAYIGFSQFMLIWYANIPEETIWYMHRLEHGWEGVTILLALGHFVIPFLLLLSRDLKRRKLPMILVSIWLLFMHYVDIYWLIMPSLRSETYAPGLLDVLHLLGLGALFLGGLSLLMRRSLLVPLGDPRLEESLQFENK